MTDHITLRRAAEQAREALNRILDCEQSCECFDRRALAALDAALAEPDVADLFARFAAKQKPLDADMAAILHANLDSLYITDEPAAALAEPEQKPEPVAWWHPERKFYWAASDAEVPPSALPLYAAPPEPDAIARAVEAEREACLKAAEQAKMHQMVWYPKGYTIDANKVNEMYTAQHVRCVEAIRARGSGAV